jgi:hypothetical protein
MELLNKNKDFKRNHTNENSWKKRWKKLKERCSAKKCKMQLALIDE